MAARPYEKMFLIDEHEYMKMKKIAYPEQVGPQTPNTTFDESFGELTHSTHYDDDDDGGGYDDGDEGGWGGVDYPSTSESSHPTSSPPASSRPSSHEPTPQPSPRPQPTSTPIPDRPPMKELKIDIPKIDHEEMYKKIEANRAQVSKEVDEVISVLSHSVQSISSVEEEQAKHVENWNELNEMMRAKIWNDVDALADQHEYMVNLGTKLHEQIDPNDFGPEHNQLREKIKSLEREIQEVQERRVFLTGKKEPQTKAALYANLHKLIKEQEKVHDAWERGERVEGELTSLGNKIKDVRDRIRNVEKHSPAPKKQGKMKEFENVEAFANAYRKWQAKSTAENELLNNDPNRDLENRRNLDFVFEMLKTSKFFQEFQEQEIREYWQKMNEEEQRITALNAKKQGQQRLVEIAKKRLAALPAQGVDLDEDDDDVDLINKSLPAIMIQQMDVQEQEAWLNDIKNLSVDDIANLTGEVQHELNKTFDQQFGVARYEEVSLRQVENQPPQSPQDVQYIEEDVEDYGPESAPEDDEVPPPYGREPEGPLFRDGKMKNKREMNILYNELKSAGVLRIDQVKREDGKWYPIDDAKKLIRRLSSSAHKTLKTAPPKGYNTIKRFIQNNPRFEPLIGLKSAAGIVSKKEGCRT